MKTWRATALICLLTATARAQFAGLPFADSAAAPAEGLMRVSGGAVIGDEAGAYGGRLTYGFVEGVALFADLGMLEVDVGDEGPAYQVGAKLTLPLGLPVDLAVRGAVGLANVEVGRRDLNITAVNFGGLISTAFEFFTPYAFAGLHYMDPDRGDSETELMLAAGVLISLTEPFSLYGEILKCEIAQLDDLFFGLGASWSF